MKKMVLLASIALVGVIGCTDNRSADKTGPVTSATPPPAGTTAHSAPNPSQGTGMGMAAMSESDRQLAQRVESALRENSSLASIAQNVQVAAKNGEVTLRGSVSNEQEKTNIASAAKQVAGVSKVENQLEVASASR